MIKNKFYAVVVLYNTKVEDSLTCTNLQQIKNHDISIVIVDNSTKDMNNRYVANNYGWIYMNMNGNVGLSKAYNKVLEKLKNKLGIVIWFDDDTNVTQEYFDILDKDAIENPDISIFVPMIRGQDGRFWSPNEARFFKNKQLKSREDKISNKRFNAINSCTAVRLNTYENYRYDERLFLDQVDHSFFYDMRGKNIKFRKLNVIINHNFSLKSKQKSIENIKKRYEIMIPDYLTFCSKSIFMVILGVIKVIGWGIREAIKYGDIFFIFWCIRKASASLKNIEIRKV